MRESISSILEIGIGEDTAPSVQAWATYFPNAHVYPIDIKTKQEVANRARPGGATDRLVKHQAQFGCEYNRSMWQNPRVHLTLETDASKPEQLERVQLPEQLDVILDDGSHRYFDQQRTLHTLWPRLRAGGFYIIEDMLVGALPWDKEHAKQVPTKNFDCGAECFFPQRLEEHPFLFDRFGHLKGTHQPANPLEPRTKELLRHNDWFWVDRVHQGGGLDCSLVIRKKGAPIGVRPIAAPTPRAALLSSAVPSSPESCPEGCVRSAVVRDAQAALQAAQELQGKLQARQDELVDVLKRGDSDGTRPCADGTMTSLSNWPLLVVLAASVFFNVVQYRRRHHHARPAGK